MSVSDWWRDLARCLYRDSLLNRLLGKWRVFGRYPFDDGVSGLKSRPLAMFFYNQRAIFLASGFIFLVSASILILITHSSSHLWLTISILAQAWFIDIALTFALHRSFVRRINRWVASRVDEYEHQPLFDRYFRIDSAIVIALIVVGKLLELNLDVFVGLLFANTIVYSSAYVRGRSGNADQILTILFLQGIIMVLLLFRTQISIPEPRVFYLLLNSTAVAGMVIMTVLSVLMISSLRADEKEITDKRLGLLGAYQRMLAGISRDLVDPHSVNSEPRYSERQFAGRVRDLLKNLCSLGDPFWYHSACLWLFEDHNDRGPVILPRAAVNFAESNSIKNGLDLPHDGLLDSTSLVLLHSLRHHGDQGEPKPTFRANSNATAAFVPLTRGGERIGMLALYGLEGGPPLLYGESAFLWSLGSLISSTMEQWEGRYRILPLKEMDELFASKSLDEVFPRAVKIVKAYLAAGGCMVLFRPNPQKPEMEVRAVDGFSPSIIRRDLYLAGVGQTGKSAELGHTIRYDDVPMHRGDFDEERLKSLEKAHGKPVFSWLAIPIGGSDQNYGVIKLVNSKSRCSWFTRYDQELGGDLARRLHVMIEKFLHIKEIEDAKEEAQISARRHSQAQKDAEALAKQRQEDLMIITHQLQGPLSSLVGTITYLQTRALAPEMRTALDDLEALVEDSIAVCYGTFTAFALLDGRKIAFVNENINGPAELRRLCARLQRTNSRPDLEFSYYGEESFPTLRMDRNMFTSVIYSLIHNAMKYADDNSHVILECSVERNSGRVALKVKSEGQPILQSETERIFEKFVRGQHSETTGRRYSGVGLGLWVARELMRAIHGDLTAEISIHNPRFSVFVVHFPQ